MYKNKPTLRIDKRLTPGVPQISVNILNFSSSITRLSPKSAIMMSASSALVRKRRFSGLRSGERSVASQSREIRCTAMNDACLMDIFHGDENGADEFCRVAGKRGRCEDRIGPRQHSPASTHPS